MNEERNPLELRFHTDPIKTREARQSEIIERASSDPSFRADLLRNPKATLSKELGVRLPDSMEIRVMEETANEVIVVLPYQMGDADLNQLRGMAKEAHLAAGNTGKTAIQFTCCC